MSLDTNPPCGESTYELYNPEQTSTFSFTNLSLEVLGEIASHLDCFSIKCFLEALPWLKKHTLHICGGRYPFHFSRRDLRPTYKETTGFFQVQGLDRVFTDDIQTWKALLPLKRPYLIKLYDIWSADHSAMKLLTSHHKDILDKLSFVHILDVIGYMNIYFSQQKFHFLGSNGSKFVESWDDRCHYHIVDCIRDVNSTVTSPHTLVSLNISVSRSFGGFEFPVLKELQIHFKEMDTIPFLFQVKAPNLEFFRVYYNGDVPIFTGIDVGGAIPDADLVKQQFELCDTKGFDYKSRPFVNESFDLSLYWGVMDLDFTKHLYKISLVGVHEAFLWLISFDSSTHLRILRTILFKHPSSEDPPSRVGQGHAHNQVRDYPWWNCMNDIIDCVYSLSISWRTNIDDSILPALKLRCSYCSFTLYTSGKRLSLSDFFKINRPQSFGTMTVISDIPPVRVGSSDHLVLTKYDLDFISRSRRLRLLTIDGCYFGGFNQEHASPYPLFSLHHKHTGWPMSELRLNLVRRQKPSKFGEQEQGGDDIELLTFCRLFKTKLSHIRVTQAIGGKDFRPWRSTNVSFPTNHQLKDFAVSTDDSFKDFRLNGRTLMPLHVMKPDECCHKVNHTWTLLTNYGDEFDYKFGEH